MTDEALPVVRSEKFTKPIWLNRGWQPVALGFIPSEKAWNNEMKRIGLTLPYPNAAGTGGHTQWVQDTVTHESIIYVTVTDDGERDGKELILTLVHEAVHVWQFICQSIGEKSPSIEAEAYGIENITDELIAAYCKTIGKVKVWPL